MVVKLNTVRLNGASLNSASLNGVGERLRASAGGGGGEVIPPEEPDVPVTYTLSASASNGVVSASVNGKAVTLPYTGDEGDVVVVEVTANDGYVFEGWSDGSTDNPRSITMTADVILSATCVVKAVEKEYIQFEDAEVESVLMSKGVSSDGVGITMEDAAKVTSNMQGWFNNNASVKSFNELQYFTGITQLGKLNLNATYAGAFYKCTALTEVTIPANVTLIGEYCFCDSSSLANVTFADSSKITYIGIGAFKNTQMAGEISFPNAETIKGPAFANTSITKVLSLGKITTIEGVPSGYGSALFDGCASLTFIELPSTLTDIIGYAIGRCDALTAIVCRATTPPNLSSNGFSGCNALTTIYVPDASLEAYKGATNWSTYADRIHPLSEIEGSNDVIKYDGLVGAYTFKGRSNEDADYDLVQDRSGNGNVMTLTAHFGTTDSVTGDIIGYNNDLLYLVGGYGKMTIPQLAETNTISVIAKRELYTTDGLAAYSAFFGVENPSFTNAVYMDYVEGGFISKQTKGSYRGRDDTKIVWMTPSYMNGHRWTDEPEQQMSGICYLGKLRDNVSFYARVKVECLYVFNRELTPSEVEAFIKQHIDASYVLPTIEE